MAEYYPEAWHFPRLVTGVVEARIQVHLQSQTLDARTLFTYFATSLMILTTLRDLGCSLILLFSAASCFACFMKLMWSSYSTAPAVIPASALFYSTPISGSPYNISVVPGAAAYPYTEAYGEGVTNASAGVFASFVIQAKVRVLVCLARALLWKAT